MTTRSNPAASELMVVRVLREHSEATVNQVAQWAHLPRRTAAGAVARLTERGMVERAEPVEEPHHAGRPPATYRLTADPKITAAAIFTHNDLRVAVVAGSGVVEVRRHDTRLRDVVDVVGTVADALEQLEYDLAGISRVVVGLPFPVRDGSTYQPINPARARTRPWMDIDLAAAVEDRLGVTAIVENTCRLAALGEHAAGAARGAATALYLQVVSGSNVGVIVNHRVLRGAQGLAGEISHLVVDPDGAPCACGRRGCLGVVMDNPDQLIAALQREQLQRESVFDVLSLAVQTDSDVRSRLVNLGRMLGRHLAAACVLLCPEVLVIDGSLEIAAGPLSGGLRDTLALELPPTIFSNLAVRIGTLGSDAPVIGAASALLQATGGEPGDMASRW